MFNNACNQNQIKEVKTMRNKTIQQPTVEQVKERVLAFLSEQGHLHPRVAKKIKENLDLVAEKILMLQHKRKDTYIDFGLTHVRMSYINFIRATVMRAKRTTYKKEPLDFTLQWNAFTEYGRTVDLCQ